MLNEIPFLSWFNIIDAIEINIISVDENLRIVLVQCQLRRAVDQWIRYNDMIQMMTRAVDQWISGYYDSDDDGIKMKSFTFIVAGAHSPFSPIIEIDFNFKLEIKGIKIIIS